MEEAVICNASEPYESSETFQNCLGEMLRALGMSDAAQPKSPHEIFQSAIAEMKRQLTNAGAEARLREALEPFVKHYEPWMERLSDDQPMITFPKHTMGDLRRAREALSAHPHASDCDKQGETTNSEASSHEKRRLDASGEQTSTGPETSISPVRIIAQRHVSAPSANHDVTGGESAATPSDRTADVTVEELADFLYDNGCLATGDDEEEGLARALLDAFTVGRR